MRRRGWLGAGLALWLIACSGSTGGPIKWIATPPIGLASPVVSFSPPPATSPPCTARNLSLFFAQGEGAGGAAEHFTTAVNHSASTCSVKGFPSVTTDAGQAGIDDHGTYLLAPTPGSDADLRPGDSAQITLGFLKSCDKSSQRGSNFVLHLGGDLVLPQVSNDTTGCGFWVERWAAEGPQPLLLVQSALIVPPTIRSGSTLRFVVRMSTTAAFPVTIPDSPCPSYVEHITRDLAPLTDERHELNCRHAPPLTRGHPVDFGMRIKVPNRLSAGSYAIDWSFNGDQITTIPITAR